MKLLKQILSELQEIKKTLQTIASSLEQNDSIEYPINYFEAAPYDIAVIRNKDVAKIIKDIQSIQDQT